MLHLKKTTNLKQIFPFIRKYSLSAGAAVFLAFTFLLILGVCKFSFYALKNHRNVRERNIISSYADVPANTSYIKETSYTSADLKKISPPPFTQKQIYIKNDKFDNKSDTNPSASDLALNARFVIDEIKRPPVVFSKNDNSMRKTTFPIEIDEKNDDAVSLDNLMISGINLLTESSEKIIASENLLKDEPFVDEKKTSESTPLEKEGKDEKVIKIKTEPTVVTTNAEKIKQRQNTPSKTYWVDVDHLRSQIKSQITSESENTVLLTADAASHTVQKEQPRFENVSSVSKTSNESVSLKEKTSSTAFSSIPTKKIAEAVKKESKTALAGNSPELWKIAKVKGQKENLLDKKDSSVEKNTNDETASNSLSVVSSEEEKDKNIIYRNGRPTDIVIKKQEKSLNWLERQEAAVWTSMSQTDTPSVWSAAADASDVPAERAKAFRVAEDITTTQETTSTEEQNVNMASDAQATQTITENNSVEEKAKTDQEKDVLNSAPLRVIGEKEKPEGKINPLLLPLGNPTPTNLPTTNVSTPVQTTPINEKPTLTEQAPPALPKVNPTGLSEILSQQKENPEQKNQKTENSEENDGLMNKLFSFFGKTETDPDEMPSLGTGSSVKSKENTNKNTKKKQTKRKVVSSSKNQIVKDDDKDIITTEMRLTFKPGSSEISAQSVKWIKDFGQRAKLDIQNAIEVRMSNLDQEIQEKRFALIRSALLGVGLQEVQIIPVVTDRTPHTIVLRMIVLPEEGYTEYTTELGGVKERMYYKKW